MAEIEVVVDGVRFAVGDRVRRKIRQYVQEGIGKIVSINVETIAKMDVRSSYVYFTIGVRWEDYNSVFNITPGDDAPLIQASSFVTGNNPNNTFRKRSNKHDGKGKD